MEFLTRHGVGVGSRRRLTGEDETTFLHRIETEAADILIMTEGSLEACAVVFETPLSTIEPIVAFNEHLQEAADRGEEIKALRVSNGYDAAVALKDLLLKRLKDEPCRVTHDDDWPTDPEMFHVELLALLPQALRDYGGSVIQMSEPLSATTSEIEAIIASDESLQRLQMICLTKDDAAAEANFAEKAATGPAAGAHKFLTNRQPEKYGDVTKHEIKNVGFEPPPAGAVKNALFTKKEPEE
jgi:hypothetical protein